MLFFSALGVSLPTFAWVALGMVLKRLGILSDALVAKISLLAFNFGLPVMLFAGAAQVDYSQLANASHLLAGLLATTFVVIGSWIYCHARGYPRHMQGVFVQAAFRSNLAIMGLAMCVAAYGDRGTALAALPVAIMTAYYNVLAVWVLNTTLGGKTSAVFLLLGVARNPLLIGIAGGIALSLSGLQVPLFIAPMGSTLTFLFLPLTLVCIGAAMQLSSLRTIGLVTWEATAWRLLVAPALGVAVALSLGVEGAPLGVLFLLIASPVAASSFVMVVAARGDGVLAANIVVLTTLFSVVSVTLGFFSLSILGLVGELV
ncbi:MAG: AEC family transporter [Halieaceae bacterium]|nr:AEC family transporter [Halieaceae bacterium]